MISVQHAGLARTHRSADPKHLYFALLGERGTAPGRIDDFTRCWSRDFLATAVERAADLCPDFPDHPRGLPAYLADDHARTSAAYRDYLDGRRAGNGRRFFTNRAHALYFLRSVA
ncbi:MAG: hypothetical protein M3N26_07465, partial [Pseudomonadota bacterium]|nr:hypothetical protein [Pseudomonadota bacterium]